MKKFSSLPAPDMPDLSHMPNLPDLSDIPPSSDLPNASPLSFIVNEADRGLRLDAFLGRVTNLSRSKIKKHVEEGRCKLDGKTSLAPDAHLVPGMSVTFFPPVLSNQLEPEAGALTVLYRDEHLAVVNKPAGLTVHPCPSCPEGTLVHRLLAHFPELAHQDGPRPGIVHRLDKDTTGLLIVALTETARLALADAFAARTVHKTYLALTRGVPDANGRIALPLGRHPTSKTRMAVVPENRGGKPALTEWETLFADPGRRFALLAVTLHTGRTHQIRVHLTHTGHPLWGDTLYAPHDERDPARRQMLHAWKLSFAHPVTGEELTLVCPPPPDFMDTALTLARHTQRVVLTGTPGCGKSSVLHLLSERGVPVWSADATVAQLYEPGNDGWRMLRGRFGERFTPIRENGVSGGSDPRGATSVNKIALAQAFVEETGLRSEVEHLIHPLVYASMEQFFKEQIFAETAYQKKKTGELRTRPEVAVAEVPLWHESGAHPDISAHAGDSGPSPAPIVVTVACPADVRRERLAARRGWSVEKTAAMEAWQWPEEAKLRASDLVLDNSGDEATLGKRVDELVTRLTRMRETEQISLRECLRGLWGNEVVILRNGLKV